MSEFNKDVEDLCKEIKAASKLNGGTIELPKETFENTLESAGLDMKQWNAMNKHRDNVISAMSLAVGEQGLNAMKKDKKLSQVTASMPCGKDKIGVTVHREKQVMDGKGGTMTKYGMTQAKYEANGASGKKGELKKVRAHLSEEALKMFG